jgi:hypothetical protein
MFFTHNYRIDLGKLTRILPWLQSRESEHRSHGKLQRQHVPPSAEH